MRKVGAAALLVAAQNQPHGEGQRAARLLQETQRVERGDERPLVVLGAAADEQVAVAQQREGVARPALL